MKSHVALADSDGDRLGSAITATASSARGATAITETHSNRNYRQTNGYDRTVHLVDRLEWRNASDEMI
ncbi:MAG: hypothetical protein ACR2KJ_09225 [Jatrophihabitans sp.]